MLACVCVFERPDADIVRRIQTAGELDCIVKKTTAGKKSLRMTDSGSTEIKSSSPRRTDLRGVLICKVPQTPDGPKEVVLA